MKKTILIIAVASTVLLSCNIDKTKDGALPSMDVDVDVDADSGALPEFDVDWVDIDVKTTTRTVSVPKVVVVMEEEEIEVPVIDFDMPGDEDYEKVERSIIVETEVIGSEHKIDISQIRASQNKLFIISTLTNMNNDLGDKKMRIQDQIDINARDLDVKHYIIGAKPDRKFNSQYTYVNTMNALPEAVKNAKVIYKK